MRRIPAYPNLKAFFSANPAITLEEFGQRVGVTGAYMSMITSGVRSPGFRLAFRIAKHANIPIESLLTERQADTARSA